MQMQHINPFNFGPACDGEPLAFGAQAPESIRVKYWVDGMKTRGIKRVICLLPDAEIDDVYTLQPIREIYKREFGEDNICWAGILDSHICSRELLVKTIVPFMRKSVEKDDKFVVHCMAGAGRTSRILAAFLTHVRKMDPAKSLEGVSSIKGVYRAPLEGVGWNYSLKELLALLKAD